MKKLIKFLAIGVGIALLSGCNNNVVTCTLESNDTTSGYSIKSTYEIHSKNDVVSKVKTTEEIKSENDSILDYFESSLNSQYEVSNNQYGGYKYKVTKKNNTVKSVSTVDYNKMDLEKYINDNSALKEYVNSDNKISLKGIKTLYESLGATCK